MVKITFLTNVIQISYWIILNGKSNFYTQKAQFKNQLQLWLSLVYKETRLSRQSFFGDICFFQIVHKDK